MPQMRLGTFLKIPQVRQRLSDSSRAKAATASVHVESIVTADSYCDSYCEGSVSYCIRAAGGTDTTFQGEKHCDGDGAPFRKCVWREVLAKVPRAAHTGLVELELHRRVALETGEEKVALVGRVHVRETQGFETFEVQGPDGAATGWVLRVEVPREFEAVGETATLQIDRLFGAKRADGATYFVRAGVRGKETRTTRPEPGVPNHESDELQDCIWQQQLLGVPKSEDGISIMVCRAAHDGVSVIGRFNVSESTTHFTSFPLVRDGEETGMVLRLHAPPTDRRRSWLPRLPRRATAASAKSSGSSGTESFTGTHRAAAQAMLRAEIAKQADGLYDEEPGPRKRPTVRVTRRTQRRTGASTTAEWDEEDETWPEEPEEAEANAELERRRRIVMPEPMVGSPRGNPRPWVRAGHRWTRTKPEELDESWPSDEEK